MNPWDNPRCHACGVELEETRYWLRVWVDGMERHLPYCVACHDRLIDEEKADPERSEQVTAELPRPVGLGHTEEGHHEHCWWCSRCVIGHGTPLTYADSAGQVHVICAECHTTPEEAETRRQQRLKDEENYYFFLESLDEDDEEEEDPYARRLGYD